MIRQRFAREDGSALVSAIVLVTVMVMLGLAVYAMADTEQAQSGTERVKESAFVLAEGALDAQVLQLSRTYPLTGGQAYPPNCTPVAATPVACPDATAMSAAYSGDDYAASCNGAPVATQWATTVRDNGNGAEKHYSAAIVNANRPWDENGDGALWVRADGVAGCQQRSIVTLVAARDVQLPFPRNVATANWFATTNQGRKVIVDTEGKFAMPPDIRPDPEDQSSQPADVSVRCSPAPAGGCLQYDANKGQISPNTAKIAPSPSPLLTPAQVDSIRALARSRGTYYTGCPPSFTGEAVFVENLPDGCSPNGGAGNSPEAPGMLVIANGRYSIGGNAAFYGVIYALNQSGLTGAVVSLGGTSLIQGAVAIDGPGGLSAGASKTNLIFDPRSQSLVKGLGGGAAVPNTWRELPRGQ